MALVKFTNGHKGNLIKSPYTDLFDTFFNSEPFLSKSLVSNVPAVNISETDDGYHVELAVPGLKKEDFKISVDQNQLKISAEQKSETVENDESRKYSRKEFNYASFTRAFTLPDLADQAQIEAEYRDGVLLVNVAKKEEAKALVREISVK
jgi:HSP20 family protein